MTTIIGVRHPESAMNTRRDLVGGRSNDAPVTARGKEQVRRFVRAYPEHFPAPAAVFSSPSVRTAFLAEQLQNAFSLTAPIVYHDDLQEMSQGRSEGQPRRLVYTPQVIARIALEQSDFSLPGGESVNHVTGRMRSVFAHIQQAYPRDTVIVSGHGQAFRCLLGAALGWDHATITQPSDPQYMTDNVSVSVFQLDANGLRAEPPRSIIEPVPDNWGS